MISIIVPIYNVEKYLEECLFSIQNQTYKDFECIMVNDGSPDNSAEIAQRFVDSDSRFRLIHQENGGLSVARNTGLRYVKGDYITFIDSDDMVQESMLDTLLSYMKEEVDIVECRYYSDLNSLIGPENTNILFQGKGKDALEALVLKKNLSHNTWAKLYRKECFDNLFFPEGLNYEDLYMYMKQLKNGHKIVRIDYVGYFYRINEQSIMNANFSKKNLDIFSICERIEVIYANDKELQPLVYRHLFACLVYHYLNYVERNNPYRNLYEKYLTKYASMAENTGLSLKIYKFSPKYFKEIVWVIDMFKNLIRRKNV